MLKKIIQTLLVFSLAASLIACDSGGISSTAAIDSKLSKTSERIEIKGLKIGMPVEEARKVINQSLDGKECQNADKISTISPRDDYVSGDQITWCSNSYKYFGGTVPELYTAYVDGKLFYLRISKFESMDSNDFPPVYKSLAEKYSVKPKIEEVTQLTSAGTIKTYVYKSAFTDLEGNVLKVSGLAIEKDSKITGDSTIEFYKKDFPDFVSKRDKILQSLSDKKTNEAEQKKKSDL